MCRPFTRLAAGITGLACALLLAGCASNGFRNTSRTFDTVVIDAGHGGIDSGAIGRNGLKEKAVALDVARRVNDRLKAAGLKTVMVRSKDQFVPLEMRAAISNRERNAVFVSIHFNHTRKRGIAGVETYWHHPNSRGLADRVQFHLVKSRPATDRGVHRANYRVLKQNLNPSILVECGYLSNGHEAALAASAAHRDRIAACIAHALIEQRWPKRQRSEPPAAFPGTP